MSGGGGGRMACVAVKFVNLLVSGYTSGYVWLWVPPKKGGCTPKGIVMAIAERGVGGVDAVVFDVDGEPEMGEDWSLPGGVVYGSSSLSRPIMTGALLGGDPPLSVLNVGTPKTDC